MKHLLQLAIVTVVWGTAQAPQASLLRAMSLAQLVTAADQIVVGHVISVHAAWDPSHRRIFSTIEIKVEDVWKDSGKAPSDGADGTLAIVQPGGTVGDMEMTVGGMPTFVAGERTLVFLRDRHPHCRVVGMSEGKRPLSWDASRKQWLVEPPDRADVVELDAGGRLRHAKPTARLALDDLREQVRAVQKN